MSIIKTLAANTAADIIYHVTTRRHWADHQQDQLYFPPDYGEDGFVHCCLPHQLPGVLSRYFAGLENLVILHLSTSKLGQDLKYEAVGTDEIFPHLYQGIHRDAVSKIDYL